VQGHGGRIWIAASGNLGTTVAFTLPAGRDPEPAAEAAPEPAPAAAPESAPEGAHTPHGRGGPRRQSQHAA
jgi:hypothetical protein